MTSQRDDFKHPVAIVGRSCRLPMATGLNDYWRLIEQGRCAQKPLPPARLDRDLLFRSERGHLGSTYADFACTVDYPDLQSVDCRLPQSLKRNPEQTYGTLAHVAFEAFEDAKLDPLDPPDRNIGTFVGHTRASGLAGDVAMANYVGQVATLIAEMPGFRNVLGDRLGGLCQRLVEEVRKGYPNRTSGPVGAGQCARAVNAALRSVGPQMTFNAACASSTQALTQAVRALQVGRCRFAVAAGASYCHSDTLVLFSKAQSLSPSGTRPLDADADGLVLGEGYVALLLCRLDHARRLGLPIHAVVQGVGLSSDGKGKSLWAPRREGQMLAIRRAYPKPDDYRKIGYIEAHATSTQLGDATEMQALADVFADHLSPGQRIPVGSVKANIGHTLETAGIAGILKCLLAMQRETIPAMPHVQKPNPKIDWDTVPLELPLANRRWQPVDDGWFCCVNSFGIGGLNTHVVLRRPLAPTGRVAMAAKTPGTVVTSGVAATTTSGKAIKPLASPSLNGSTVSANSRHSTPIAVIGAGAILPGAIGAAAFFETLRGQRVTLSRIPAQRWSEAAYPENSPGDWSVRSRLGGVVTGYQFDWKRHRIPPKQVAHASPLQFMILDAVEQATEMAGLDLSGDLRLRCGVVVGTTFGGEFSNQLQIGLRLPELRRRLARLLAADGADDQQCEALLGEFSDRLLAEMPALLDETGSFTSSSLASRVTKNLDLMGGAVAVDSGCTSFGSALTCCVDQLSCGDNDLMVCVGAQQDLGPSRYVGMTRSGMLGDSSGGDGLFPGEGAVAVVLQRLSDAERAGRRILGVIQGVGSGFDSVGMPRSLDEAMATAIAGQADPQRDQPASKRADHFVEHSWAGPSRSVAEVQAALAWMFRSPEGGTANFQAHDSSRLVGHLGGGSMAVSMLAALGRCQDQRAGLSVNQTANSNLDREHWIVGGSPGECTQAILLRSY